MFFEIDNWLSEKENHMADLGMAPTDFIFCGGTD